MSDTPVGPIDIADPVDIVDSQPARIRRPLDLIRLSGLVVTLAVLAGFGAIASSTTTGANSDLNRLLDHIPRLPVHLLSRFGAFAVLIVPVAFLLREVIRGQARRLVEGLLTGVVAIVVVRGLDLALGIDKKTSLYRALTVAGSSDRFQPLDAYLAAIAALITVTGITASRFWGRALITVTALYMFTSFAAAQASLLSLISSIVLGALVGVAVRYVAGEVNDRPDATRIVTELRNRGLHVVRLVRTHRPETAGRADTTDSDHREYRAWTGEGQQLMVHVLDRDLVSFGAFYSIYRVLRLRAEIARPPLLSLERLAERRSLLAYAMMSARAPIRDWWRASRAAPTRSCWPTNTSTGCRSTSCRTGSITIS